MEISCTINGVQLNFQVDTGSHLSTINKEDFSRLENVSLKCTRVKAKSYSNDPIKFLGEVELSVTYRGDTILNSFLVVENKVSLIGRDLLSKLGLVIYKTPVVSVKSVCVDVIAKYKDYLCSSFKSQVKDKVSIALNSVNKPMFCKARVVPIRLKAAVKTELKKLEASGIISRVSHSEWASPIVCTLKRDGNVRICGDYSRTINRCMKVVKYPLPSIDDVMVWVGKARLFSKVDLKNAFLQLPLTEECKNFTTINTSEGLFVYNFLPFGTCSSPGIFQGLMYKVLNGLDNVIIYQDDILILASSKEDHDKILDLVLGKLKIVGMKINFEKSEFNLKVVEYLGHCYHCKRNFS